MNNRKGIMVQVKRKPNGVYFIRLWTPMMHLSFAMKTTIKSKAVDTAKQLAEELGCEWRID